MFGILGAPDVEWTVALEGGRLDIPAGGRVRAMITLRPRQSLDARRVVAALVGLEEYQYREREIRSSGSSSSLTWGSNELSRQEIQLIGPGPIGAGEVRSGPVEFAVPADAAPEHRDEHPARPLEAHGLDRCRRSRPEMEQQVVVPLTTARLNPADAASMGAQVQTMVDGQPVSSGPSPRPSGRASPSTAPSM